MVALVDAAVSVFDDPATDEDDAAVALVSAALAEDDVAVAVSVTLALALAEEEVAEESVAVVEDDPFFDVEDESLVSVELDPELDVVLLELLPLLLPFPFPLPLLLLEVVVTHCLTSTTCTEPSEAVSGVKVIVHVWVVIVPSPL